MDVPPWTTVAAVGCASVLLCACCAWTLQRWFRACAAEQRRALRDGEFELNGCGGRWRLGRRSSRQYARVPVTDPAVFARLPA